VGTAGVNAQDKRAPTDSCPRRLFGMSADAVSLRWRGDRNSPEQVGGDDVWRGIVVLLLIINMMDEWLSRMLFVGQRK
jgi:hypothetical protein